MSDTGLPTQFEIVLTDHGKRRLKERLGLKIRAMRRYTEKAFTDGVPPDKYYMREIGMRWALQQERRQDAMYLFYADNLFVFSLDVKRFNETGEHRILLVTVINPMEIGEFDTYVRGEKRKEKWLNGTML